MAFIGEIQIFASSYVPGGWLLCDGSLVSISEYQALFTLIGTTYGGDGQSTFALPDLGNRVPIHAGQGPGLSPRVLGQFVGQSFVTLTPNELPAHSHQFMASQEAPVTDAKSNLAQALIYKADNSQPLVSLASPSITNTDDGSPHPNEQPFLSLFFAICPEGVYPH